MKEIKFNKPLFNSKNNSSFIANISGNSNGKHELLLELKVKLKFPDYFGNNWDSLYDCLRDFHWIQEKDIFLIHDKVPNLEISDLNIYVQILSDAAKSWKEGEEHSLEIVFPEDSETAVLKILK